MSPSDINRGFTGQMRAQLLALTHVTSQKKAIYPQLNPRVDGSGVASFE